MEPTLRPMSTSQVLDNTFSLYRQNFLLFVGVAMLPQVCLLFGRLGVLLIGLGPSTNPTLRPTEAMAAAAASLMGALIVLALALACYAVASAASVYAVSCRHLGYTITIQEAYRQIRPYILNALGVVFLIFLGGFVVAFFLIFVIAIIAAAFGIAGRGLLGSIGVVIAAVLGMLGFVVMLLYASARISLAIPACVLERLGPVDAIRRSLALTRGSALRLVLVLFLTAAVYYGLALVFSIPYMIGLMRMFSSKNFTAITPYLMWQYVGDFIASSLASPLAGIAITLIYYDERVRKEAFDLQWMMVLLGRQSPEPAQPQSPAQEPPQPEGPAVTPSALG